MTHLVWQRTPPVLYEGCTRKDDWMKDMEGHACTWEEAKKYCASSALTAALGGSGWRLPTKIELESIVDELRYDTSSTPTIDTLVFPNTEQYGFWTLSPYTPDSRFVWGLAFNWGWAGGYGLDNSLHVRCVRAEPRTEAPKDRYEIAGDTVKDRFTELTWQRQPDTKTFTWDGAAKHCQGLGAGWRLPGAKELLTLVDPRRVSPAIDTDAFPNTLADKYWSASPQVEVTYPDGASGPVTTAYHEYVDFRDGSPLTDERDQASVHAYHVRCVK